MPTILYLVHDLSDPAVARRVTMLEAGGARVQTAGFCRAEVPERIGAGRPIMLGATADGDFRQRLAMVATAALGLRRMLGDVSRPDVIVARTLEMLALARRATGFYRPRPALVYESLDIHRLLLGDGLKSRAMRAVERALVSDAALLMTSSPAFVREYFELRQGMTMPTLLLENKVLDLGGGEVPAGTEPRCPPSGQPWTIGWFGALRCRKSLDILSRLTRMAEGRIEVVLRGRPALREFDDFHGRVAKEPFIRFEGPYRNPDDLSAIYGEVHFAWAIDYFEAGLNSDWLLPNRLYESCLHGVVPIALSATETGRTLARRDIGIRVDAATPEALLAALPLNEEGYAAERARVTARPRSFWVCGPSECTALVARLAALPGEAPPKGRAMMEAAG